MCGKPGYNVTNHNPTRLLLKGFSGGTVTGCCLDGFREAKGFLTRCFNHNAI